jgi:hypothetical protein
MRCEAGRVRRGTQSGGARESCGGTSGRAGAGRLMGVNMGMRVSTGTPTRQFCLGYCEKAVEGEFIIYGKYMLVLECLRYLLLAGLKLYLSIFESKPFPLRLGKYSV